MYPPPPTSSNYPYPQYNHYSNITTATKTSPISTSIYSGYLGQPSSISQSMLYPLNPSTIGARNQQISNVNGPLPVRL